MLAAQGIAPQFATSGDILFARSLESAFYRVHPDGTGLQSLDHRYGKVNVPISTVSPDQQWAIRETDDWNLQAYSRRGDGPIYICDRCIAGWSSNGKFFVIAIKPYAGQNGLTGLIPLRDGVDLPDFPASGIHLQSDLNKIPGVRIIAYQGHYMGISPSPDGSSFAFVKQESHWNLYRIPLP
jgi:hypothetical protein